MLGALLSFVTPVLLILACQRLPILDRLGLVLLSFSAGIFVGSILKFALGDNASLMHEATTRSLSEICIAIAIPLLVFSLDLKSVAVHAKTSLVSMIIAVITITASCTFFALIFAAEFEDMWQVAGMTIGAYTGGGPNMAAINAATEAQQSTYITMVTYDVLVSAIYLLFMVSVAKTVFGAFLRPYPKEHSALVPIDSNNEGMAALSNEGANQYRLLLVNESFLKTSLALICSIICVALSLLISGLFPESAQSVMTIILITTFGLTSSFLPMIRNLPGSFQLGNFFILVFCFAIGSMTDLEVLKNLNWDLFHYIGLSIVAGMTLHAIIAYLLRIDADTFMITSAASILSVPFIPVIAGAIRNKALIAPGFAVAILGYLIGSYLGIAVAFGLKFLLSQ